jgi:type IV secretory pathway VirB4 component
LRDVMVKVENITKNWKEAGSFAAQVNLYGFWDEHCFLTKSGDPGTALQIGGVDYESLDHTGRDYYRQRRKYDDAHRSDSSSELEKPKNFRC